MPTMKNVALEIENKFTNMTVGEFKELVDKFTDGQLVRLANRIERQSNVDEKKTEAYKPGYGTNGLRQYGSPQDEPDSYRQERERYWKSLGKKIRKGARV